MRVIPERRFSLIEVVQVGQQPSYSGMQRIIQQPPVNGGIGVPLAFLAKFGSHEHELFARMGPLVGVQRAQPRCFPPVIARHLIPQRAFSMDDLVVGKRQHIIFGESVYQREGEFSVVESPVDRILVQVPQGVIHPPHVPLKSEPKPTSVSWGGHSGPGCGLFGDHDDARIVLVGGGICFLQEADGFKVLAAAVNIGAPRSVRTRVVQIKHGSYRVDSQPIDVEFAQPVQCVGNKEVPYLSTAKVEHQRAPVRVFPTQRVRVLIKLCAIEVC